MLNRFNGKIILAVMLGLLVILIIWFKGQLERNDIAEKIAQKIMLDIRYYCADTSELVDFKDEKKCITPVTALHDDLKNLISDTSLGSIILFAENFTDIKQTLKLTEDLQQAALSAKNGKPLLISVDQEGGRVVRLPRAIATSFSGNMAVGATYENHGIHYATVVGEVLGAELSALGINVNHSPDVDVNINPNNPVINVRSFGENPEVVAKLGSAMLEGLQSKGVIGTLKHFPGHGDTNVDSHTGLPQVNHSFEVVDAVDLLPFQYAIDHSDVKMIMTAHIQYPALDDSLLMNRHGESMIKPATLSKEILTDLLRKRMGFKGVVITDALNMAGISDFFTQEEAVVHTFNAGADIAMMPMSIRQPSDIPKFKALLDLLVDKVISGELSLEQVSASAERIIALKETSINLSKDDLETKEAHASATLATKEHRLQEQLLAQESIVEIKPNQEIPKQLQTAQKIHLVFPKQAQANAMSSALNNISAQLGNESWLITTSSLEEINLSTTFKEIDNSDLIIVASDNQETAVELGQAVDIVAGHVSRDMNNADLTLTVLKYAKEKRLNSVFISLQAPYNLAKFQQVADWVLASFDGKTYQMVGSKEETGAVYHSLAQIITGQRVAKGVLPISI
ncbi:glycoside hydrolase family 3 N-terminal domain-containing protein [Thalassotalea profundi]|uniref:beta-N-acetylhexosaminidase n=1 Tax=Thalassotalea profundi TaxID=2036687 RepID=A0ABQ3J1Y4_9GAMM|nr:glycoside hydrolase family 3 N-terminal domain-containing protein [Thalassotalea profundi]GHE98614.1 beta-N-acetylhexosaminidase [Thalassotalea profundi]